MTFLLDDIEDERRPTMPIDQLVAEPGFAPRAWQSGAPDDVWSRGEVEPSAELTRILNLPVRIPPEPDGATAQAMIELITPRYRNGTATGACKCAAMSPEGCITRLRFVQAWSLYEAPLAGGLLAPVGVGHGKTLLNYLMPLAMADRAGSPRNASGLFVTVLLIPAKLMQQAIENFQLLEQHWQMPRARFHGSGDNDRAFTRGRQDVQLHVLTYERLSRPENTQWLVDTAPHLIIADECDKIGDVNSARTSRFLRYLEEHHPMFCGWSGSMSDAALADYAHLAKAALGKGSPLPRDLETVQEWGRAIDPSDNPADPGALMALCDPSIVDEQGRGEHIQAAFYRRLVSTLGVVHTTSSSADAEVIFEERDPGDVPRVITEALGPIRNDWIRPDDWSYDNALEASACARQLACGFYYRWEYPRGEKQSLIDEWRETRKAWCGELRARLRRREPFLDSEKLLKDAAMRAHGDLPDDGKPVWESLFWPEWRDIRDKVQPISVPQLLHTFLIDDAAEWANTNRGIVWYSSTAYGRWLAQAARLPMYGGPGPDSTPLLTKKNKIREDGSRSMIASINSHGRGVNGLQFIYADQHVAQPPSSSEKWEQMLGRLARPGQKSPSVRCCYYGHTSELVAFIRTAINRAHYVRRTLGQNQRILTGLAGSMTGPSESIMMATGGAE